MNTQHSMKTLHREFRVDKTRIGFIKFIFEAHEGVAVITTLDAQTGHVRMAIAPGLAEDAFRIIADLKKDFMFDAV
ncbi:MAG: DUF4911 domain-containing protein [Desulfotignum sp.]|jgi:hypothetical protein|nr:DUF4911 domain-containing protein [Desulfotignum sp.]